MIVEDFSFPEMQKNELINSIILLLKQYSFEDHILKMKKSKSHIVEFYGYCRNRYKSCKSRVDIVYDTRMHVGCMFHNIEDHKH
jgi:hypothetical protein